MSTTKSRRKTNTRTRNTTQTKPASAREPLPTRPRPMDGDHTLRAMNEARATYDAAHLNLPVSPRAWTTRPNGAITAPLPCGGTLQHHAEGPRRRFTAALPCPKGAHHIHLVTSRLELNTARNAANACTTRHGSEAAHQAITNGIRDVPARLEPVKTAAPTFKPVKVHPLPEGIHRATAAADETQPMSTQQIAAGLTARADAETPKEHPQP